MSSNVSVTINGKDNTGNAIAGVQAKLASLGKSVSSINFMQLAEKGVQALKAIGEASGAASSSAGRNFQSVQDVIGGVTARLGALIFGNGDLMKSFKLLLASVLPLVETLLNGLLPVIVALVKGWNNVYAALTPAISYILSYALPVLQKLATVVQITGNSFQIASAYLTGNTEKVKAYRAENAKLMADLAKPFERATVNLKAVDPDKLQALGAKVRTMKDTPKKEDADAAMKAADARYDAQIKLYEADKLSADELRNLTIQYVGYKSAVNDSRLSEEARANALDSSNAFEKIANDIAAKRTKALDDESKALDTLTKREEDRVAALTKLVGMKKGTANDKQSLRNERDALKIDLPNMTDAVQRLNIEQQIDDITTALGDGAKKVENTVAETYGAAIFNGFSAAFHGEGISAVFKSFFSTIESAIGSGIQGMIKKWAEGTGTFLALNAKIYASFGKIMAALSHLLSSPWTAAAGAIAIGVAVGALARSLGKQSSGGSSYAGASTFSSSSNSQMSNELQGEATIIIQGGLLDMSNPQQARALQNAIQQLSGRRVVLAV